MPRTVIVGSKRVAGGTVFTVRWREHGRMLTRDFDDRRRAKAFAAELKARL